MQLTILGNNSALPAYGRYPTAQVLEHEGQAFLIDCGEGAQMRMQQFGVKAGRIDHVFISHIHGDHYLGLVGFISSQALLSRVRPLHVYCPPEIREYVLMQLPWEPGFPLHFHLRQEGDRGVLLETNLIRVSCFPVFHSVPTHGFLFETKRRERQLLPEALREYEVPRYFYGRIAQGEDYRSPSGKIISNAWVTVPGPKPKRYAYCADTRYAPEIIPDIARADLLYHESTYLHEHLDKAELRLHSTARQAGEMAAAAGVTRLLLGHFSSKYRLLEPLLHEAQSAFAQTELALEGMVYLV